MRILILNILCVYFINSLNLAPIININSNICLKSVLWGRKDAGGWFLCQDELLDIESKCIVFSYGLGADWSFDNAAEDFGCIVHGFDPSGSLWRAGMHGEAYSHIDYVKQYPSKNKFFHSWGLGVLDKAIYPPGTIPQEWPGFGDPAFSQTNDESWDMRSIEQTMKDLSISKLSILKIDVEGAEWTALTATLESKFMRFKYFIYFLLIIYSLINLNEIENYSKKVESNNF